MALTKISTGGVKDDAASQAKIADEAIDEARLQISNAGTNGQFLSKQSGNTGGLTWATVDTSIADDSITHAKIADDAIGQDQLAQNAVVADNLTEDCVTNPKIADGAVTEYRIGDNEVTEPKLKISNAGTNGQYLQKQSGNTGGLTWADVTIPAAGHTIDLVADGDIGAGKAVIIKSNGKAERVHKTFTNRTGSDGPDNWGGASTVQGNSVKYIQSAYDKAANVYMTHYQSETNPSKMVVRAGQVYFAGGYVSFGTALEYETASGTTGVGICSLGEGTKKFLITYNVGNDFKARVIEVSGTSSNVCTAGSAVEFDNGGGTINPQALAFDPDTSRAVCVYRVANDGTNGHRGYACVFSVSGTTVSAGTPVIIENSYNNNLHSCCYDEHSNRLAIGYINMTNNQGYIRLATVSSSSNTLTIHGVSSSFEAEVENGLVLTSNNKGQVAVGYNKQTGGYNNGRVAATLFTIDASNNTVSFGSYGLFSDDSVGQSRSLSIAYQPSGDTFVMTWGDNDTNDRLTANLRGYSGTTWSSTTSTQTRLDNNNSALYTSVLAIDNNEASCIVAYALGTVQGQARTFRTASGADNFNADKVNFLGFADAAISDGNTGTIIISGVVGNQSGFTPGTGYLLNGNGGFSAGAFNGGPGLQAIASDKGIIKNGIA